MSNNTTNKGHVLLGLILGLMVAVFAALIAFMLMTKNTTPINDNNAYKENQEDSTYSAPKSNDPNKSLYSKVPLTQDEKKPALENGSSVANSSHKANKSSEEAMQEIIEHGISSIQPEKKKKKKELPEYIDQYGEKHIGTPTEHAISINKRDPDEVIAKPKEEINPNAEIDPIKNILSNKSESKKPIKTKSEKDGIFYVQVGSFKSAEQADRQKAVLLMQGMQSNITEAQRDGSIVHRVRLGPFYSKKEVDDISKNLNSNGMPYKVIKTDE